MARDRQWTKELGVGEPVSDRADRRAFIALYHHFLDLIYKYCYRRLPTAEDAEDAKDATSLVR